MFELYNCLVILIGMTGPIGHGKSTFASALAELEPTTKRLESSLIIAEVANTLHASTRKLPNRDDVESINQWLRPLPSILLETVKAHATFEQVKINPADVLNHPIEYEKLLLHIDNLTRQPELLHYRIKKDNKETFRPILQWLGGYLVQKVDPQIWYKELVRRAYAAQDKGCQLCIVGGLRFPSDAEIIHGAGGKIIKVHRPGHLQYDMLDPTERERENIKPDCEIISDKGVKEIKNCARKVLEDLQNNRLKDRYVVSQS